MSEGDAQAGCSRSPVARLNHTPDTSIPSVLLVTSVFLVLSRILVTELFSLAFHFLCSMAGTYTPQHLFTHWDLKPTDGMKRGLSVAVVECTGSFPST